MHQIYILKKWRRWSSRKIFLKRSQFLPYATFVGNSDRSILTGIRDLKMHFTWPRNLVYFGLVSSFYFFSFSLLGNCISLTPNALTFNTFNPLTFRIFWSIDQLIHWGLIFAIEIFVFFFVVTYFRKIYDHYHFVI